MKKLRTRSECPTSSFLDVVGDRWSLLVIRDILMKDKATYSELADSKEQIPTNLLADRLKKLVQGGLLKRQKYQDRPARYRYEPTAPCIELLDVIAEMAAWSNRNLPETKKMEREKYAAAKAKWKARA